MKKTVFFVASLLVIMSVLCVGVFASGTNPSVVDEAGILTSSEEEAISSKIEEIVSKYDFDVLVLLVGDTDGYTPHQFSRDYYITNGYGCGSEKNGCMLLISLEERDVVISSNGSYGEYAFTEFGRDHLLDKIVDETGLSYGEYYDAVMLFVECTEDYLKLASEGKPFDEDSIPIDWGHVLLVSGVISLVVGIIASLIYISSLKSQLKSVALKKDADNYIDASSLRLSLSKDTFLYSNVTKTPRPKNNSSGRSGGGISHSSTGSFHSSGRKF